MTVRIIHADMLEALPQLLAEGVQFDAVVTDPPYGIAFMGRAWDAADNIAFRPETWAAVLAVMKPGAHLIAFSGTRTYHRMACAIEDAGFEIRDQLGWLYGSGFPKSHNVGDGIGTALKPAWEPMVLARKPFKGTVAANVLANGCGGLNIDACRVGDTGATRKIATETRGDSAGCYGNGLNGGGGERDLPFGRWPANVIHDGSDEVLAAFPQTVGSVGMAQHGSGTNSIYGNFTRTEQSTGGNGVKDSGSAARFFYSAKADAGDRLGSKHPTVKPVDLMAYLLRLVTPAGGLVLDPFAGSGTTGMAALREGFDAVLIEREAEYVADIRRRVAHVSGEDSPLFAGAAA